MLKPTQRIILNATTEASSSEEFYVVNGSPVTITLGSLSGLVVGENADLKVSYDKTNFADLVTDQDGKIQMNSTNVSVTIHGVGLYRVDKGLTTNAASVLLSH